jgi:prepilin-type N-terminal cleavage/methylation domain-containing protein
MRREHGFSLLELTVAMAVMLTVTGSIFTLMNPAQGTFQAQPEVSDMQQRLRVATDTLYKDLVMAGGGAYQGSNSGSMIFFFASVLPFRQGTLNDDPPGTFRDDIVTLMYVPPTTAQTSLKRKNGNSLTNSSEIFVNAEAGCPVGDPLCGFSEGMTMLIYDESGNYDTFTVTQVQESGQLKLQHNNDKIQYPGYNSSENNPGLPPAKIVQANYYEYYRDAATNRLMFYDGSGNPDVPIADNVVGLNFEYYGDPQPPAWVSPTKAVGDPKGPWTTYGPRPMTANTGNCVFDNAPTPGSLLPSLGAVGSGLVKLATAQLTDGPWCPTAAAVNRWDADLLRIRKVVVTARVQAASDALRGPASTLFSRAGTSRDSHRWVPDQEIRFEVSPRNLNLGR